MDTKVKIKGDMPGDSILITDEHVFRAEQLLESFKEDIVPKMIIAVSGPSGSGKSETAALLGSELIDLGYSVYIISCDNYARLPPRDNETRREEIYHEKGKNALKEYLGSDDEIKFDVLDSIIREFKSGVESVELHFIDNKNNCLMECASVDVKAIDILILEGTWSSMVNGTNLRLFLQTDFEKTLEHRKNRARDPITHFGEIVLDLEQHLLDEMKHRADVVIDPDGKIFRQEDREYVD